MARLPATRSWLRAAAVSVAITGLAAPARANGRFPSAVDLTFEETDAEVLYLSSTFGLLVSRDGGASFSWVCESAVGYGGTYDPAYAVGPAGELWATTPDGLRVSRDGACSWESAGGPLGAGVLTSDVAVGGDGRVWVTTSTVGETNDVFVSTDAGFAPGGLAADDIWWTSVRAAPGDADRIYVSGLAPPRGDAPTAPVLRRTVDGGATWDELPVGDLAFRDESSLVLLAVSPVDPDVLFARVQNAVEPVGDAVYRSDDAGQSWTSVVEFGDVVSAFSISADGKTLLAATAYRCPGDPAEPIKGCVRRSRDGGLTWSPTDSQPQLRCLAALPGGGLLGCANNWDPDNFALGASTDDGESWNGLFRFADMVGPLECAAGTTQRDTCSVDEWPDVCFRFGVCADPGDGPVDESGGCCRVAGGGHPGDLAGGLAVAVALMWWSRRRRPTPRR
jgi:hypothetical protein